MDEFGFLKVAAAVPHVRVADCAWNAEHLIALAQQAAQLQAIDTRQHQVEDDQVGLLPTIFVQHMIAPGDHLDMEVVALQVAGDQLGQGAVVFDQENIRHRCLGIWVEVGLYAIPVGAGLP
ncbi:MAG: hypothetical protein RR971_02710, partial [Alistipes sp.]